MKKTLHGIAFTVVMLTFVLASCTSASTPTPTLPTATLPPATETPIPPTSTPTLAPVALAGPQAGTAMRWIDTSTLVYVPGGEFTMGNEVGDAPTRTVSVDGYWIQQTEVTYGMYAQCVASGACTPPTQEIGAPVYTNLDYSSYPVVGVTWDQANAYCTWAQGQLPTEAQWEKAARGATGSTYPWGEDGAACDYLNFAGCVKHTTDVTDYPNGRSTYGLYDMAGNVYEWVQDWYSDAYYNTGPNTNPAGPDSGQYRAIRGSSFETDPSQVASAIRHYGAPTFHSPETGFRCAVPQPKPLAPSCQMTAYIPSTSSGLPQGQCQLPDVVIRGQYCAAGDGYVTLNISQGADYKLNRKDYTCTDAIVDGKRVLTCKGVRSKETSAEVTVCNTACSNSPDQTGATATCDPGYTLDPNTSKCTYAPIPAQVGETGCPTGYVKIDRGGQQSCALAPGASGQCPAGLYFDSLYGACISPSGLAEIPYGINNPDLATQTFQGCAPGSTYDSSFQCCQATTSAAYPGCPPGTTYSPDLKACKPTTGLTLTAPGCVTVSATTLKCSEPIDVCSKITAEAACIRNSYACQWNERLNVCELKK